MNRSLLSIFVSRYSIRFDERKPRIVRNRVLWLVTHVRGRGLGNIYGETLVPLKVLFDIATLIDASAELRLRRVSTFSIYYVNRDSFGRLNFCGMQLIKFKKMFHIFGRIGNGSRIGNLPQFISVSKALHVSQNLFYSVSNLFIQFFYRIATISDDDTIIVSYFNVMH